MRLTTILLLLLFVLLLTALPVTAAVLLHPHRRKWARLLCPVGISRRMSKLLRLPLEAPSLSALSSLSPRLIILLDDLRQALRDVPPLPAQKGLPRLLTYARAFFTTGDHSPAAIADALSDLLQDVPLTHAERSAWPLALRSETAWQLADTLADIHRALKERQQGERLAERLKAGQQPEKLLGRRTLPEGTLAALLEALARAERADLISATAACLLNNPEAIRRAAALSENARAESLYTLTATLTTLSHMDWTALWESRDPLDALLSSDTTYRRMDPPSRALYRGQVSRLARLFRRSEEEVGAAALSLSARDNALSLDQLLLSPVGQGALRRALGSRKGRLRLFFRRGQMSLYRLSLALLTALFALIFLRLGHSLWLTLLFLLPAGALSRRILRRPKVPLPALSLPDALDQSLRTLIVLPITLGKPQDAPRAVRQLMMARLAARSDANVDCLLLADHIPARIHRTNEDLLILEAAANAVAALNPPGQSAHTFYLHRSRVRDPLHFDYIARSGTLGAIQSLCRLIVQGECEDTFDAATLPPADLFQRYAFLLVLPPDAELAPGALRQLLAIMAHPRATPVSGRGFACLHPTECPAFLNNPTRYQAAQSAPLRPDSRMILLRPAEWLEAVDRHGLASFSGDPFPVAEALSGAADTSQAMVYRRPFASLGAAFQGQRLNAELAWHLLSWVFPFRLAADGVIRSPLTSENRFVLRERLREAVLPLAFGLLTAFGIFSGSPLATLLALVIPCAAGGSCAPDPLIPFSEAAHLPSQFASALSGLLSFICRREIIFADTAPQRKRIQWGSAAVLALASLTQTPVNAVGLITAGLFSAYRFFQLKLDAPLAQPLPLTQPEKGDLRAFAEAAWGYFLRHTSPDRPLPPSFSVDTAPVDVTSPADIAMYLLACVSADALDLSGEPLERMSQAITALADLDTYHGLYFTRYALDDLVALDRHLDAADNGLLCAALVTSAQALRVRLARTGGPDSDLPVRLDSLARSMDLHQLYDPAAGLFFRALNESGTGEGHERLFASRSLLLSVIAAARGDVPVQHLQRLSRARGRSERITALLSPHGTLEDALLPGLFLPLLRPTAINAHQQVSRDGLWGRSTCAPGAFDENGFPLLIPFGLPELSAESTSFESTFASFAAALALPYAPADALRCLRAHRDMGAVTTEGFADAVSLGSATVISPVRSAAHQGMMLCAIANTLADAPIRGAFSGLPAVRVILPLLKDKPGPVMPFRHFTAQETQLPPPFSRPADVTADPEDAWVLGVPRLSWLLGARGASRVSADGQPLLRDPFFLLTDEGRAFRLNDAALPGETTFAEGSVTFTRRCGSLQTSVTQAIDSKNQRVLLVCDVTNLSTRDRVFTLETRVQLDNPDVFESVSGVAHALVLRRRDTKTVLTMDFVGAEKTFAQAQPEPLLRAKIALGGRARKVVSWVISLTEGVPLTPADIPGILAMARLRQRTLLERQQLSSAQASELSRLVGPLMIPRTRRLSEPVCVNALFNEYVGKYLLLVEISSRSGLSLLAESLAAHGFLIASGQLADLVVIHSDSITDSVMDAIHARDLLAHNAPWVHPMAAPTDADRASLAAAARVVLLEGSGTLSAQLLALRQEHMEPTSGPSFAPGLLPDPPVYDCENPFGGVDHSGILHIRLAANEGLPAHWMNALSATFSADETGFGDDFQLTAPDGQTLSAFDARLPRIIEHRPGITRCTLFAADFEAAISVAVLSDVRVSLRLLRLKSHARKPLALTLEIHRDLSGDLPAYFFHDPNALCANTPGRTDVAFLAGVGEGWTAESHLTRSLLLPAGGTAEAAWVFGHAEHPDRIPPLLREIEANGPSATQRFAQDRAILRISRFSVNTPEPTLDLFFNRILPWQALTAPETPPLRDELIAPPLTRECGESEIESAMLRTLALTEWAKFTPGAEYSALAALRQSIRDFAWNGTCFGNPKLLSLSLQALGALIFPEDPLVRDNLRRTFSAHFDSVHGLIRNQFSFDVPARPGTASNGAHHARDAAWMVRALAVNGLAEEAWALLRAMNPLHHTDTPERLEEFRASPMVLPAVMLADDDTPGRALPEADGFSAALLYDTLLTQLLGLDLFDDHLVLHPRLPEDWDGFTATCRLGRTTLYISIERRLKTPVLDTIPLDSPDIPLPRDGKNHQLRFPTQPMA